MSAVWFQSLKRVKSDATFLDLVETLEAELEQGTGVDATDPQGRTALELLMAKPAPSALAVRWLLDRGADPSSCADVRWQIGDLYPEATDSSAELLNKQYRAAPYLMLLAADEARHGVEEGVADSGHYADKFAAALATRRRIDALKSGCHDLCCGFRAHSQPLLHPWQSHWGGLPWLPQASLPAPLAADPRLVLAVQINFDELIQGELPHPLPSHGLLQIYVTQPDEDLGEEPGGEPVALFWPEVPADAAAWRVLPERRLTALSLKVTDQGRALSWRPYRKLPEAEEQLAKAMERLPTELRPRQRDLEQERASYDFGLLPRLYGYEREMLPEGHQPLLHMMHTEHGGSLFSLPTSALAGNATDWQQLTHTYYYD
ncbi:DUF1963 domain-containing protein [Ferrimonas sp. YFM]|uniref:DUF1963 domain-containing protein n=1 Tax=Ferrimonas sp. YFM TaxID=3028878 RepID=UPI0025737BF3|nr:DUF1963 domain-containing protein [Ferrimonas sp. YFM]BDY04862.1 hypothetical protein F0521_19030 [Ferrimonas sp. YFM]